MFSNEEINTLITTIDFQLNNDENLQNFDELWELRYKLLNMMEE